MDRDQMQLFWVLAESKEEIRTKAIGQLLLCLTEKQGDAKKPCEEVVYTLQRLVKGLASPRKWVRLGFTGALTQVLRKFKSLKVDGMLEMVEENLKVNKSDAKSEQSHVFMGRIMVYLALIQSDRIQTCKEDNLKTIVQDVLQIRQRKSPLHMLCTQTLTELIVKISDNDELADTLWELLKPSLSSGWAKCSPDTLWLLITAGTHLKDKADKTFLTTHWKTKRLLNEKNYAHLERIMMQSTEDHPIIHPVCTRLIQDVNEKLDQFDSFWSNVIYGKLFNGGCNRTFLVFQLIPEALKLATTPDQVYSILNPAWVTCFIKHLTYKQQVLHSAAKQLRESIVSIAKDSKPSIQIAIVTTLITSPGVVLFDNVTKGNTVKNLINGLSPDAVKEFCELLMKNIQGKILSRPNPPEASSSPDTKPSDLTGQQRWSITTMSNFVTQASDSSWCNNILEFLFKTAFFQDKSDKTKKKGQKLNEVRADANKSFFRSLDRLSKQTGKGVKGYQAFNDCLQRLVQYVQSLMKNAQLTLVTPLEEEEKQEWDKVVSVVNKIKKKREKTGTSGNDEVAFELLFLHHGLQLFTSPESALDVLNELHTCYEKACSKKKAESSSPAAKRKRTDMSEEPNWVDVIIDLLMSLLSQHSHLVRMVVNTVFTMICPHLTKDNLQLVLEVLKPSTGTDDSILEFNSDDEGEENMEEVKEESESESEEESEEEEESDDDEENVKKLRSSVKTALGSAAVASDQEDSEETSDDDMDDDAMFRLDSALTAAFKGMVKSKKKDQDKETNLKHYKMRCLDLIEILIHHTTSAILLLELIPCLLSLMETGALEKSQKDLSEKARKVFQLLVNVKKFTLDTNFDKTELPNMVENIMEESTKLLEIPMIQNMAGACIFVVHVINCDDGKKASSPNVHLAKVQQCVEKGLNDFCLKRDSSLSHYFFFSLIEKEPTLFWPLADTLLKHATDSEVKIFRKTQAVAFLSALITKSSIKEIEGSRWGKLSTNIISSISQILEKGEKKDMKPRYLHEILTLLHKLVTLLDVPHRQKLITEEILEMVQLLKTSVNQDTRKVINKILGQTQANEPGTSKKKSKKKRKRTPSESKDAPNSPTKTNGHQPKLASGNQQKSPTQNNHMDSSSDEEEIVTPKKKKMKTPKKSESPKNVLQETGNGLTKTSKKRRKSEVPVGTTDSSPPKEKKKRRKSLDA